jgi:hypothetical protein
MSLADRLHATVVEPEGENVAVRSLRAICADMGDLLAEKRKAYGDSFANVPKILAVLFPDGIHPSQFDDVTLMIRCLDKFNRLANRKGGKDSGGESPWKDLAGYGVLGQLLDQEKGR